MANDTARVIKRAMENEGKTWGDLAKEARCAPATLSLILKENGERTQLGTLLRVCRYLRINPRDLFPDAIPRTKKAKKEEKEKSTQKRMSQVRRLVESISKDLGK